MSPFDIIVGQISGCTPARKTAKAHTEPVKRRGIAPPNPWRLTAREAEAMDCLIVQGSNAGVAAVMGCCDKTAEIHLRRACEKIGLVRVPAAVAWDRFRRAA